MGFQLIRPCFDEKRTSSIFGEAAYMNDSPEYE